LAATRDRALTVAEIADHAFALNGRPAARAQRLSATRAAHRVIRRMKEARAEARPFYAAAHREAEAAVGPQPQCPKFPRTFAGHNAAFEAARKAWVTADARYNAALKATEPYQRGEKIWSYAEQFGTWARCIRVDEDHSRAEYEYWRATADKRGTLHFYPPDVPVQVWRSRSTAAACTGSTPRC
jgi:hypothetical protein